MVESISIEYVAGLFDGAGFVGASYKQSDKYSTGYHVDLILQVNAKHAVTMGLLDEFCEYYGFKCSFRETSSGSHVWRISSTDDIERFLEMLMPHLVENYEDAQIMTGHLIPRIRAKRHLSEEGLIEIAGFVDALSGGRSRRKFTQEHFIEEFER